MDNGLLKTHILERTQSLERGENEQECLSLDPMMGDFPSLSPYNYIACNPIKLVDPDGRASAYPTPYIDF